MVSAANRDAAALAKEIKTQLKQARELINQRDHNAALKICEVISSSLLHPDLYMCFGSLDNCEEG